MSLLTKDLESLVDIEKMIKLQGQVTGLKTALGLLDFMIDDCEADIETTARRMREASESENEE